MIQQLSEIPFSLSDRARIVKAAISSVKDEVKISSTVSPNKKVRSQNRLLDPALDARGLSRVRLEKAVRKAEADMIKLRYKDALHSSDTAVKVEALAKVAFHRSGSLLTKSEIKMIQEETSMCDTPTIPDCLRLQRRRTINGTCNNLERPLLGSAGTNFRRLLAARYEDGIERPAGFLQSVNKDILGRGEFEPPYPSPREISRTVIRAEPIDDPRHTHIIMQWGQFLDHDLDLAPEFGEDLCPEEFCKATETCFPIRRVSDDEPFEELPCLFFGRSIPSCDDTPGTLPAREQFNVITHFIDGSNVYGSTEKVAKALRLFKGGLLKVGPPHAPGAKPSLPLLPREELEENGLTLCPRPNINEKCYVAGDVRVNEHLGLTVMHTIWMREHNRIVKKLAQLSPSLSDEELYQIGRQVVGGMMQSIVFREYLPEVLGRSVVRDLVRAPEIRGYDPSFDPSIVNAYATAAFRYGHSLIRPEFARLDKNYQSLPIGPLNLLDSFFNSSQYNTSFGTDPILRGLLTEAARRSDEFLNPVLTTKLFASADSVARDLASLNINRGRDHGLPPYLVWREFCIKFFARNNISVEPDFRSDLTRLELLRVYGSLDTVDLFAGGMAEEPYIHTDGQKSIVGPTFTCIFILNYQSSASGDRFYYLNRITNSPAQMEQYEKTSLSKVICNNADNIRKIQPNAFVLPKGDNSPIDCDDIPDLDLTPFVQECKRYLRFSVVGSASFRAVIMKDTIFYSGHFKTISFSGPSGGSQCLELECPEGFSRVLLYPANYFSRRFCSKPNAAPGLPSPTLNRFKCYNEKIGFFQMTPANGIYSSLAECESGKVDAVSYSCSRRRPFAYSTSEEGGLTDIGDIMKAINKTEEAAKKSDKGNYPREEELMNVLNGYQPQDEVKEENHESYRPKAKVTEKNSNNNLIKELDDALKQLEDLE